MLSLPRRWLCHACRCWFIGADMATDTHCRACAIALSKAKAQTKESK